MGVVRASYATELTPPGFLSKLRGRGAHLPEPKTRGGQPRRAGGSNLLCYGSGAQEVASLAQIAALQEAFLKFIKEILQWVKC